MFSLLEALTEAAVITDVAAAGATDIGAMTLRTLFQGGARWSVDVRSLG